jgi:hypothetical protein
MGARSKTFAELRAASGETLELGARSAGRSARDRRDQQQKGQAMKTQASEAQIADALDIPRRTANERAKRDGWQPIAPPRRGRRTLYDITRLPADVRKACERWMAHKLINERTTNAPHLLRHDLGDQARVYELAAKAGLDDQARLLQAHAHRNDPNAALAEVSAQAVGVHRGRSPRASAPRQEDLAVVSARGTAASREAPTTHAEISARAALYEAAVQSRKDRAKKALDAVCAWDALRLSGFRKAAASEAVSHKFRVSLATVGRWLAEVEGVPRDAWLYFLLDRRIGRTAIADMSAEAWEVLKGDYLRPERPSAKACITRLIRRNREQCEGWILPSPRTLLRRLNAISRPVRILARQGAKALSEAYPSQQRSKSALRALQIVSADGYKHNLWVRFPDGDVVRAKTFFWQDVYSNKILAWRTDKTEHTDMVRLSFADLLKRWGLPQTAVLDNTMAAANKTMSGGVKHRFRFKVREDEVDGLFKTCGIELIWATPGHGQAKPIERAFGIGGIGEYVDKHPAFTGAWTGANPSDKPDYDGKSRAVDLAELRDVLEREVAAWNALEDRRSAMAPGRSFDAVFLESYAHGPVRVATEEQLRRWLLASEPVRVQSDGSIVLDAGRIVGERLANRYWSRELFELAGRMVIALFDPHRLHEGVHICTSDSRYVGFAQCDRPQGFNDRVAARERSRARNQFTRGARQALQAQRRMDALDVAKGLAGEGTGTMPAPRPPRSVIQAEFSQRRYVPRERTEAERAELARLERDMDAPQPVNVMALPSDPERHSYWKALDQRRAAGEDLTEAEAAFWTGWQTESYFRNAIQAERDFDQMLAERQNAA